MSNEKKEVITEGQFRAFCGAALPHLNDLTWELRKLGYHGMASFAIADDGYFSFSIHDSEWSMNRLDSSHDAHMRRDYGESVDVIQKS